MGTANNRLYPRATSCKFLVKHSKSYNLWKPCSKASFCEDAIRSYCIASTFYPFFQDTLFALFPLKGILNNE